MGSGGAGEDRDAFGEVIPDVVLSSGHQGVPRRSRRWRGPPWSISPLPEGRGRRRPWPCGLGLYR